MKTPISDKVAYCVAAALALAAIGMLGTSDYNDALIAQAHYCSMVESGMWPDYNETYGEECAENTTR